MSESVRKPDGELVISESVILPDNSDADVNEFRKNTADDVNSVEGLTEKVEAILAVARRYPSNRAFKEFIV